MFPPALACPLSRYPLPQTATDLLLFLELHLRFLEFYLHEIISCVPLGLASLPQAHRSEIHPWYGVCRKYVPFPALAH